MITVACIIPTLDERPEMLANAIKSVENQTVPFKEVFIERLPGRENPDNQAIKINNGISKVTADAYVFMGDDDELKPNFVEVMSKTMEDTEADMVSSFFENFGDENGVHGPGIAPLCSTIVRKTLWDKVGGHPLNSGPMVDGLFYFLCIRSGAKWVRLGDVLYRSRIHNGQYTHTADWELSNRRKNELFGDNFSL